MRTLIQLSIISLGPPRLFVQPPPGCLCLSRRQLRSSEHFISELGRASVEFASLRRQSRIVRSLPHFPIDRQICTFSPSPALRVSPFRPPRSPVSAVRLRSFLPSFPPFQYSIEAAASSDRLPKREKPLFASRVNIQSSAKEGDLGYVARSSGPIAKSPIGDATTWSGRRAV